MKLFGQQFKPLQNSTLAIVVLGASILLAGCGQELSSSQYVERARAFQTEGDLRSSIIELKNALSKDPKNPEARWLLGKLYVLFGDGISGEKELRHAIQLGVVPDSTIPPLAEALYLQRKYDELLNLEIPADLPKNAEAELRVLRGRSYLAQNKVEEAKDEFNTALFVKKDSAAAQLGQALLAAHENKWEEARSWSKRALDSDPDYANAWSLIGRLDEKTENYAEAEKSYTKAIDNRLNNGQDLLKRALVRLKQKKYELAKQDITALRKISSRYPGSYYVEGRVYYDQKLYPEAQTAFEEELSINDNHIDALYYIALAHYAQDHLSQSEQALHKLSTLFPGWTKTLKLLARIYLQKSQLEDAKSALDPVLDKFPEDVEALTLMGDIYIAEGTPDEGIIYLRDAVELEPEASSRHLQLGLNLLNQRDRNEGFSELNKAVQLDPESQQARLALAIAFIKTRQFEKALEIANQFLDKDSKDPTIHNLIGVALMSQGMDEQARKSFEQAISLQPGFGAAQANLAELDLKTGNMESARNHYLAILEQDTTNLPSLVALAKLAKKPSQINEVLTRLEQAWEDNPGSKQIGTMLLSLYLRQNERNKASSVAKDLLIKNREDPFIVRSYGLLQLVDGANNEAAKHFLKLTELQPNSIVAWRLLAEAQTRLKDYPSASQSIDQALGIKRDDIPTLTGKIKLLILQNNFDKAQIVAQDIIGYYPSDSIGYKLEGDISASQGEFSKAATAYRSALDKSASGKLIVALSQSLYRASDKEAAIETLKSWLSTNSEDRQVRILLGKYLELSNRPAEAISEYERLARDARNKQLAGSPWKATEVDRINVMLNQAYLRNKEYDKAIAASSVLIQQTPNLSLPYNLQGVAYMAEGNYEQARKAFNSALQRDHTSISARMNLAELDTRAKDSRAAAALYRQILEQEKGHVGATLKLARILGYTDESIRYLKDSWKQNSSSIQVGLALWQAYISRGEERNALNIARTLKATAPENWKVMRALGMSLLASGNTMESLEVFQRMAELRPDEPEPWHWIGVIHGQGGDKAAAASALNNALEIQKDYLPSLVTKARIDLEQNRLQEAIALIRKIQSYHPEKNEGYSLEGDLHMRQQQFLQAVSSYQKAYDKAPSRSSILLLSQAQWKSEQYDAALGSLQKWLEQHTNDYEARLQLAAYLQQQNRHKDAISEYELINQQVPNQWFILNNLASLYSETGNPRAMPYAEQALQLAPEDKKSYTRDTLGWILVQNGNVQRGLELLQQSMDKASDMPAIRYHLAIAYEKTDQPEKARTELELLLSHDKPFPERESAKKMLNRINQRR